MIEECTTFSVWQRKTVPTIRVHQQGDDAPNLQATRLQEVIDSAPHFAKVLIVGGTYQEQLVISKAIELCGEDGDEPTIISRGPTITISSDVPCFFSCLKVKTKSLTLQTSSNRTDPPAVSMSTGKAVFFRCELTSVYVCGTASPVIERCLIQGNGGGSGLIVRDSASGSYLTNEITDHSLYCLEVLTKGTPKFVNNDIHASSEDASQSSGVGLVRISGGGAGSLAQAIHGEVAPTFIGNKIQDAFSDEQRNNAQEVFGTDKRRMLFAQEITSQRVSVAIEYANPTFKDNTIEGGIVALSVTGGAGTYTSNVIQLSILCGLYVSRGSQASFQNNKFAQHSGGGIFVDGCSPVISNCSVMQCRGVGVSVNNSKDFVLTKCLIEKSRVGVSVIGHSGGSIVENQVQRNEIIGIRLSDLGTRTNVEDNVLQMNGGCGIYAVQSCAPRIVNNVVHSQKAGLIAATGALVTAEKNHIYGNEQFAVSVQENTCGVFRQNKFANGALAVVRVADRSAPLFEENTIDDGTVGILCLNRATGRFLNNRLRGHGDGVNISTAADPFIEGNTFNSCNRYGCFCVDDAFGTVCNNFFTNMMIGVGCFKGAETVIRGNMFETSMHVGGVLGEGSRGLIEKNTFTESKGHGLVITGSRSHPRVLKCSFVKNEGYGVLGEKEGGGLVERCYFTGNGQAGFGTEDDGETRFIRNHSFEDDGPGIQCQKNGAGKFLNNLIENGRTVGCRVAQQGRPTIQQTTFRGARHAGITLEANADGDIVECIVEKNQYGIVAAGEKCRTYLNDVHIRCNTEAGVVLNADVEVTLEKCHLDDQAVGLRLVNSGPANLVDCSISGNDRGVICEKGGQATLKGCSVLKSKTSLIEITDSGQCTIKETILDGCDGIGIHAKNKARGHFLETKVSQCRTAGVVVEHHADPKFELCTISENKVGVIVRDQAVGTFADTSVVENTDANISCRQKATTVFTKCIIAICKSGPGIICSGDVTKFNECQVQRNLRHGFLFDNSSKTLLRGCTVQHNKMSGAYCCPRSEPTIQGSKFVENEHAGMFLTVEAEPTAVENEIVDNLDGGVICMPGARGNFLRNTIKGNTPANVRALKLSQTSFSNNVISSGKPCGVTINGSQCKFDGNSITQNNSAGVYVVGPSEAEFTHNTVTQNTNGIVFEAADIDQFQPPHGVDPTVTNTVDGFDAHARKNKGQPHTSHSGSSAMISTNSFQGNRSSAVILRRKSFPTITQNSFFEGEIGITIRTQAAGVVEHNTIKEHKVAGLQILGNLIETKIRFNNFEQNDVGMEIRHNNRTSVSVAGRGYTPTQPALTAGDKGVPKKGAAVPGGKPKSLLSTITDQYASVPEPSLLIGKVSPKERRLDSVVDSLVSGSSNSDDSSDEDEEDEEEEEEPTTHNSLHKRNVQDISSNPPSPRADKIRISTIVIRNRFTENKVYGIYISDGSETQVTGNDFQGETCAVGCSNGAAAQVFDNTFTKCCVGIHLSTQTNLKVFRNQFLEANEIGVYSSGGIGEVSRNIFSLCLIAGVCVEHSGAPTVTRNLFTHNTHTDVTSGIYTRRGGGGFFSDNDIHENSIGIRCDNGGLGTFSNCFVHDNVLGLHAMAGGKCTVSQTFFTSNKVADVCSSHGGGPIVNRCVLYDCVKPFLIREFGGGIFSFNVVKNVDGSAVLIQFPTVAAHEARVAAISAQKKRELDVQQMLRPVLNSDETINREGVDLLTTIDIKLVNTVYRVAPTFSSNLIVNCGAGVEVDLGYTPKDKFAKLRKSDASNGGGGSTTDEAATTAAAKPGTSKGRKSISKTNSNASSMAVAVAQATQQDNEAISNTRKAKVAQQANYVSPMPDLQTLQRGDYWGFFTQNIIQQCISGVLVHRGCTDRQPKFRFLFETSDDAQAEAHGRRAENGPSMEEFDGPSDPKTAVSMTDDVFMTYFDGNTIIDDDVGVTMRHGGNARFERNFIAKCMRYGILVSEEGRGEFYENCVTDCGSGYCLNVLGDPTRGAASNSVLPCYANFQCNVFSGGRTCAMVSAPEVRFHKNRINNGDQGLVISSAGSGLFLLNIVFEHRKIGCICMSEQAILLGNWFYSPVENGAIEMKIENPINSGANRIPPGNAIKNQFTPRLAKPEPASKISLNSDHVSEAKSAKDQKELFQLLRDLHDEQLPSCGACGCSRLGVMPTRELSEAFEAAKKRTTNQKLQQQQIAAADQARTSAFQQQQQAFAAAASVPMRSPRSGQGEGLSSTSRGIVIHDPLSAGPSSPLFGLGGLGFGASAVNSGLSGGTTLFKASSSKFGRQAEGGLAPSSGIRHKSIQTMEEMRQEIRNKREERSKSKVSLEPNAAGSDGESRRRKSSVSRKVLMQRLSVKPPTTTTDEGKLPLPDEARKMSTSPTAAAVGRTAGTALAQPPRRVVDAKALLRPVAASEDTSRGRTSSVANSTSANDVSARRESSVTTTGATGTERDRKETLNTKPKPPPTGWTLNATAFAVDASAVREALDEDLHHKEMPSAPDVTVTNPYAIYPPVPSSSGRPTFTFPTESGLLPLSSSSPEPPSGSPLLSKGLRSNSAIRRSVTDPNKAMETAFSDYNPDSPIVSPRAPSAGTAKERLLHAATLVAAVGLDLRKKAADHANKNSSPAAHKPVAVAPRKIVPEKDPMFTVSIGKSFSGAPSSVDERKTGESKTSTAIGASPSTSSVALRPSARKATEASTSNKGATTSITKTQEYPSTSLNAVAPSSSDVISSALGTEVAKSTPAPGGTAATTTGTAVPARIPLSSTTRSSSSHQQKGEARLANTRQPTVPIPVTRKGSSMSEPQGVGLEPMSTDVAPATTAPAVLPDALSFPVEPAAALPLTPPPHAELSFHAVLSRNQQLTSSPQPVFVSADSHAHRGGEVIPIPPDGGVPLCDSVDDASGVNTKLREAPLMQVIMQPLVDTGGSIAPHRRSVEAVNSISHTALVPFGFFSSPPPAVGEQQQMNAPVTAAPTYHFRRFSWTDEDADEVVPTSARYAQARNAHKMPKNSNAAVESRRLLLMPGTSLSTTTSGNREEGGGVHSARPTVTSTSLGLVPVSPILRPASQSALLRLRYPSLEGGGHATSPLPPPEGSTTPFKDALHVAALCGKRLSSPAPAGVADRPATSQHHHLITTVTGTTNTTAVAPRPSSHQFIMTYVPPLHQSVGEPSTLVEMDPIVGNRLGGRSSPTKMELPLSTTTQHVSPPPPTGVLSPSRPPPTTRPTRSGTAGSAPSAYQAIIIRKPTEAPELSPRITSANSYSKQVDNQRRVPTVRARQGIVASNLPPLGVHSSGNGNQPLRGEVTRFVHPSSPPKGPLQAEAPQSTTASTTVPSELLTLPGKFVQRGSSAIYIPFATPSM